MNDSYSYIQTHTHVQAQFQSDFCPLCGALIELDTHEDYILCQCCKKRLPFVEFTGKPIKTDLKLAKGKEWLRKYEEDAQHRVQKRGRSRMVIQEKCPKCGHHEMRYHVMQTRSVDQGSTVFYECEMCSYTYSVNN